MKRWYGDKGGCSVGKLEEDVGRHSLLVASLYLELGSLRTSKTTPH